MRNPSTCSSPRSRASSSGATGLPGQGDPRALEPRDALVGGEAGEGRPWRERRRCADGSGSSGTEVWRVEAGNGKVRGFYELARTVDAEDWVLQAVLD